MTPPRMPLREAGYEDGAFSAPGGTQFVASAIHIRTAPASMSAATKP